MTLIGAVKTPTGMVIGSDGLAMGTGAHGLYGHQAIKLWQWSDKRVVWGYEGIPATGVPFGKWLATDQSTKWCDLERPAADAVKRVNEDMRNQTNIHPIAGQAAPTDCSVLLAGELDDGWDILTISADGVPTRVLQHWDSAFIGVNNIPAKISWDLLDKVREENGLPSAQNTDGFQHFLEMLVSVTPGLAGFPIGLWEIGLTGNPGCILPEYLSEHLSPGAVSLP